MLVVIYACLYLETKHCRTSVNDWEKQPLLSICIEYTSCNCIRQWFVQCWFSGGNALYILATLKTSQHWKTNITHFSYKLALIFENLRSQLEPVTKISHKIAHRKQRWESTSVLIKQTTDFCIIQLDLSSFSKISSIRYMAFIDCCKHNFLWSVRFLKMKTCLLLNMETITCTTKQAFALDLIQIRNY